VKLEETVVDGNGIKDPPEGPFVMRHDWSDSNTTNGVSLLFPHAAVPSSSSSSSSAPIVGQSYHAWIAAAPAAGKVPSTAFQSGLKAYPVKHKVSEGAKVFW